MDVIKILVVIVLTFLILFPMMPFAARTKRVSTIHALKYEEPHNRKNAWYLLLVLVECLLFLGLTSVVAWLVEQILSVEFIANLISQVAGGTSAEFDFVTFVIFSVILNVLIIYVYAILKALLKKFILDPAFHIKKEDDKKDKKDEKDEVVEDEQEEDGEEDDKSTEERRVPIRKKSEKKDKKEVKEIGEIIHNGFWSMFFEGDKLQYAKGWVVRAEKVLQGFVYFAQILYAILFFVLLYTLFFPVKEEMYNFLVNVIKVQEWYVYPFISLIFLQELCNVFHTTVEMPKAEDEVTDDDNKTEEEKEEEMEDKLRSLHLELQRRFDAEHCLRYYPEAGKDAAIEYVCTNRPYASSLDFIQKRMKEKSGRIVHSYME